MIDELIEEMNSLRKAKCLLEQIYLDIGPYGHGAIRPETLGLLTGYFDFDDSE